MNVFFMDNVIYFDKEKFINIFVLNNESKFIKIK